MAHKKLKNDPQKLDRKLKSTFFPYCLSFPKAQTEESKFQNMANRPTVYRTGLIIV